MFYIECFTCVYQYTLSCHNVIYTLISKTINYIMTAHINFQKYSSCRGSNYNMCFEIHVPVAWDVGGGGGGSQMDKIMHHAFSSLLEVFAR